MNIRSVEISREETRTQERGFEMAKLRMLVLFVMAVVLAGCGMVSLTGSGSVVTQEEAITGFDRLDVSQGFHVDVSQGEPFKVVIRVDDNLVEHLQVVKEGTTLKIGLEPGTSYNLVDATLEADVRMPALVGADLSGGSHLGGEFDAGDVTFKLSGGSHVTLSGSAGNLTVEVNGGSHAKLGNLAVVDANVNASGGSHATVNPSGTLTAKASGGSHVKYVGSPTLGTIDKDGSSSVEKQ
jgi:hypothetical protein